VIQPSAVKFTATSNDFNGDIYIYINVYIYIYIYMHECVYDEMQTIENWTLGSQLRYEAGLNEAPKTLTLHTLGHICYIRDDDRVPTGSNAAEILYG
jgi:hypothetical protein